jgi:predicted hydrocarbon binding protein
LTAEPYLLSANDIVLADDDMVMSSAIRQDDFFEFVAGDGVMKNRLTNGRAFLFGSSAWGNVREDLRGTYGTLGIAITEQMGQSYGRSLGKIGRKLNMDLRAFFETMVRLGSTTGWGNLSLSGGDPTTGCARFRLESCVFCEDSLGHEDRLCEFFSGVIRGAADEITGKAHSVIETECTKSGSDHCGFYMERLEDAERY